MDEFTSWTRRKFLRNGLSLAALTAMPGWAKAFETETGIKTLTILHTNDWHSRIDPFPDNDPKYPGQGGAAKRAALISSIRAEQDNVLLLDAGDVFQGTPYFNFYGGEPEFKLMSAMGYEAATLGNHDFDNGIEGLVNKMPFANFPFVNCNYDVKGTLLEGKLKKSIILNKNGLRIGILGVGIDLVGLVPEANWKGIHYNNPIVAADHEASYLKNERKCDMVICLSHLGFQYDTMKASDHMLAAGSKHIDLILGGHTHTFLEQPVTVMNQIGNAVTINQVGWAGLRLGRLDYHFSNINNVKNQAFTQIEVFNKSIAV
jgi:5'-nucleotidase